jgi:hypothetical protein
MPWHWIRNSFIGYSTIIGFYINYDYIEDLRRQIINEPSIIPGFGSKADTSCNKALEDFAKKAPGASDSTAAFEYDRCLETFEATLDAPLQVLYLRQLGLLREPALSVGRALDAYGLAALRSLKTHARLRQAKSALDEAFAIRFHQLGVWHVDTVETFNKIASVHLHMGNFREACRAYEEVYLVRKAIFGMKHPSVAISAHSLANVHLKLS